MGSSDCVGSSVGCLVGLRVVGVLVGLLVVGLLVVGLAVVGTRVGTAVGLD